MKTTKKQQTHQRMLNAASQSFRSKGYAGIGVDGIAKAAGVTSGAFYSHLGSKDKAFRAALDAGLDEVIAAIPKFQKEAGKNWVRKFSEYYLGKSHRDDLACGCAMTTLSPEVVRANSELHIAYEEKMKIIAASLANGLKADSQSESLSRAWALLGILIGGLTMARAVNSSESTEKIAASIIAAAVQTAGSAK